MWVDAGDVSMNKNAGEVAIDRESQDLPSVSLGDEVTFVGLLSSSQ